MKRNFKKDFIIHIEGNADSFVISNLVESLFKAISEIISKEHIECAIQDRTTYEIFD